MSKLFLRTLSIASTLVVAVIAGRVLAQDGPGSQVQVALEQVAGGFVAPVDLDAAPGTPNRLYVVDQPGVIYIVDENGQRLEQPFLDIQDRVVDLDGGYDERGLLGLAFHPDFADNGRFYVYYSAPLAATAPADWNHTSHLSEFTVMADNADQADPASERILLSVDQPQMNHNGGDITFGPDGFLYIPIGDGGGANDTDPGHTEYLGNAQDLSKLLGKILRVDVDGGDPYGIPADNPYVTDPNALDEIYAYGFRNPWRISFDDQGQLYAADAGQDLYEEVSLVQAGGNYGWNIKEATYCFDPANPGQPPAQCAATGADGQALMDPIIEFGHDLGNVVVGGETIGDTGALAGQYVFGTWSTDFDTPNGQLYAAVPAAAGELWSFSPLTASGSTGDSLGLFVLAVEKGGDTLYVLTSQMPGPAGSTGAVWRLTLGEQAAPGEMTATPGTMDQTPAATAAVEPTATPQAVEPTATMTPGDAATPVATPTATGRGGTPSIVVVDQTIASDGTVRVDLVVSPGPGWVVIHADSSGTPGQIIGWAAVPAGESANVVVPIQGDKVTQVLHAMLHVDAGTMGTFEFPGADVPATDAAGNVVSVPFTVSVNQ